MTLETQRIYLWPWQEDDAEYNLKHLENISKIAVQVHLFYLDLIFCFINKTNNIPVKFDLYITIIYPEQYNQIKNYINILN